MLHAAGLVLCVQPVELRLVGAQLRRLVAVPERAPGLRALLALCATHRQYRAAYRKVCGTRRVQYATLRGCGSGPCPQRDRRPDSAPRTAAGRAHNWRRHGIAPSSRPAGCTGRRGTATGSPCAVRRRARAPAVRDKARRYPYASTSRSPRRVMPDTGDFRRGECRASSKRRYPPTTSSIPVAASIVILVA